MKNIFFITIFLIFGGSGILGQEVDSNTVNSMLKQFQAKGILNAEQAAEAQKKLKQITPAQWAQIRKQAQQMKNEGRVPARNTTNDVDAAAQMIDPNSPEFKQTMDKLKGILQNQQDNLDEQSEE